MYDNIQVIRYMGNKNRLLEFIIPEIKWDYPYYKFLVEVEN